jgi:4-hydroxy-4-methyl-2-oxoglutarate aldolase
VTDREQLLKAYQGLRVTDVCDGMDALGYHDIGQMSDDVRPLWRDTDNFSHRIYGFAHTVRFVPTQRRVGDHTTDEFYEWMQDWYSTLAQGPFGEEIQPGDVIVVDAEDLDTVQ